MRRNTFRCFVCGASGGPIDLVMRYLNKTFLEATKWLGGTPLPAPPRGRAKEVTTSLPSGETEGGRGLPRFRFPQGSECGIYNLPVLNLLQPGDALYITEGCSDCWAMLSAGHKAIAIPSATLLKKRDVAQLLIINSQLSIKFRMYPDRDEPGERLFLQLRELLPSLEHLQLPPGCKDFSDYYLMQQSG